MQAVSLQPSQPWVPAAYGAEPDSSLSNLPPELQMLAAMARSHGAKSENARHDIDRSFERLASLREQIKEAIERAREEKEDAGFWSDVSSLCGSDIAMVAGAIAGVALVACTAGAAGVVLAAVAVGMSVGAKVGEELDLDPKICMALQLGGALLGLAGGNFTNAHAIWTAIRTGALVVQGGATVVAGGAHVAAEQCEAGAIEAQGDAQYFRGAEQLENLQTDTIMSELKQLVEQWQFMTNAASSVRSEQHAVASSVLTRMGG